MDVLISADIALLTGYPGWRTLTNAQRHFVREWLKTGDSDAAAAIAYPSCQNKPRQRRSVVVTLLKQPVIAAIAATYMPEDKPTPPSREEFAALLWKGIRASKQEPGDKVLYYRLRGWDKKSAEPPTLDLSEFDDPKEDVLNVS